MPAYGPGDAVGFTPIAISDPTRGRSAVHRALVRFGSYTQSKDVGLPARFP
ncbi:MAG TPA: hypothetical protein VHE78_07665 [Gemmatimonadaceae bacterium]|nr:hypothetical protein [Gemmatimonadaceae bacterium]